MDAALEHHSDWEAWLRRLLEVSRPHENMTSLWTYIFKRLDSEQQTSPASFLDQKLGTRSDERQQPDQAGA